ncbi:MAG: hypothetical protein ACUVTG_16035, partial [Candidatus Oleimicrobiaceae bacterium]
TNGAAAYCLRCRRTYRVRPFHIEFHPTVEEMSSEAAAVLSLKANCSVRRGQEARWPSRLAEDTTAFSCIK